MYILSPNYSRFHFFFSPPAAGLTNRGPVRDSDPGAPLFTTMMMIGQPQSRWQLRRQAPDLGSPWRGTVPMKTMGRPMWWIMRLSLPASCDHHPTYAASYIWWKPLLHTALSNLNVWIVGSIKGVTSECCWCLDHGWCGVYGIVCILRYSCEHLG